MSAAVLPVSAGTSQVPDARELLEDCDEDELSAETLKALDALEAQHTARAEE